MEDYCRKNQQAWEYGTYDYWCAEAGSPIVRGAKLRQDPRRALKRYAAYLDNVDGLRIANICGSCGKKAVPLALLGAEVTVFDISRENRRYAMELAQAAGTQIHYQVCDIHEIDITKYEKFFDIVFFEGGVLHYFHDLNTFFQILYAITATGGKLVCSDFHPFNKTSDALRFGHPAMSYFDEDPYDGPMPLSRDDKAAPVCSYRKYTLSSIINAMIQSGFALQRFDEHPAWTDSTLPGEFTVIAIKEESL